MKFERVDDKMPPLSSGESRRFERWNDRWFGLQLWVGGDTAEWMGRLDAWLEAAPETVFKNAGRGAVNNYIICDQAVSETDSTRDTIIIIYFFFKGGGVL